MTQRNWHWEAKQLLPHLTDLLAGGVTVQAGGGGLVAHALDSTTWHVGTLAESQAPWAVTDTEFAAHTGNANAHHAQLHNLADPTHHSGQLPWAWLGKTGSDLAHLETRAHDALQGVTADQHHNKLHNVTDVTHHTISGAPWDVVGKTAAGALGLLTPQDSVTSAQSALLKATAGRLTLYEHFATGRVRTPLVDTAAENLTLSPAGSAVVPTGSIVKDLGDYNRKWRSLYAAELYVETLVAQDVLATIGGRIMVAPTTKLLADITAGQTTIDVAHNNLTGAYIYMASAPGGVAQVEVMRVTAGPTTITGGYRYTVTRNADGSGANAWLAGDAVANIGAAAGQGWLDLTSTTTARNHLGPTLTVYARTGMTAWTDAKPVVSVGNLRSFVDYGSDEYGFGLGNDLTLLPQSGFSGMTGDRVQGLRMFNTPIQMYNGALLVGQWAATGQFDIGFSGVTNIADRDFTVHPSGYVRIGRTGANTPNIIYYAGGDMHWRIDQTPMITFRSSDGSALFSGPIGLGSAGGIYQGTGTFATPTTGLKWWNDSGVGRLAGYSGGILQAGFNSSGKITAGNGAVELGANGVVFSEFAAIGDALVWSESAIVWGPPGANPGAIIAGYIASPGSRHGIVVGLRNALTGTFQYGLKTETDQNTLSGNTAILGTLSTTGAATIGSTLNASGSISSTSQVWADGGQVKVGWNSPAYGVGIEASQVGGWARGFGFLDGAGTRLAQFGAYGGTDALSFLYIGLYLDYVATFTPSTKASRFYGAVNSDGGFQRGGTDGGIYVPMTPINLTDASSNVWSGAGRATGTHTFDMNWAANGTLPAGVKAVALFGTFTWAASSNNSFATIQAPSAPYGIVARAQVNGIANDVSGVVAIDANGQFTVTISGVATTVALLRVVGYYI